MSNTTNNKEILNFQFLSSKKFINELIERNFPAEEHNLLLSAHLLAIGFNTSGINEGSVNVSYSRRISPIEEKFCRPTSNFSFQTTRNGIIEESLYFSRQSIVFNHEMFRFSDTRGFRDFCIEYFDKYSKTIEPERLMPNQDKQANSIKFRLSGKKRKSEEGQLYAYKAIISSNPKVQSLIDMWMLEKELGINESKTKKLKL